MVVAKIAFLIRTIKNFIFCGIAMGACLLLFEVTFRVYYFFKKEPIRSEYLMEGVKNDPWLGWTLEPNSRRYLKDSKGQPFLVTTNREGLKTREFSTVKSQDVIKIICLGDSITEGPDASNDQTYPNLLENLLNTESKNKKFEVYNAGISDYGIAQEYLLLERRLLKHKPDIVILGYYLNDGKTFFHPKNTFLTLSSNRILKNSALYHALEKVTMKYMIKIQYKYWEKNRFMWKDLYSKKTWVSDKNDVDRLIHMAFRDWGIAWQKSGKKEVFDKLNRLVLLSQKHNFKLMIICFPVEMQIYAAGSNTLDLLEPQKEIEKFCKDHGIIYLDPRPTLKKYKSEALFFDHCHYTHLGLNVIANKVFKTLKMNNL
ncbi:MAG: SGNH/GDSL hydrolase family protein [Deltaproteobacteria bacterium]|nr:SGNH/GDSL hydrolase family protein [Deltaproteobacteria bacterium]